MTPSKTLGSIWGLRCLGSSDTSFLLRTQLAPPNLCPLPLLSLLPRCCCFFKRRKRKSLQRHK